MNPGNRFIQDNFAFATFGIEHLVMISITALLSLFVPIIARRFLTGRSKLYAARTMSITVAATVILWTLIRLRLGQFDITTDLPLDICNLTAILLPFLMWNPTKRVHQVLYFLILAGTLQAVLTPDLPHGFPHFYFLKYWTVHGGLVVCAVYYTVVFRFYPEKKSILFAFVWLQIYTVFVFFANVLLGANYFYLMHKPPAVSLLDYLGPWPWYLLVCEGVAVVFFIIVYLPILTIRNKSVDGNP